MCCSVVKPTEVWMVNFRHFLHRMTAQSFWHLHDLICDDPIFISTGRRPQRSVKYQLATFLCQMGAEAGVKTAGVMSITEGSVFVYTRRVCRAIHTDVELRGWRTNLKTVKKAPLIEASEVAGSLIACVMS